MNVWQSLKKPLFVLAPMDDVTDTVFRQVVASCAPPDIFFTEFASADGLQSNGRKAVLEKLRFSGTEKPIIAQIWGMKPENYFATAKELVQVGFDGVDINMGCPVPKIIKLGACSALINNRSLAAEIIEATKEGTGARVPISVKTRVGFGEADLSWTSFLLEQELDALIVHGRTSKQQSKVPNNWQLIEQVRQQRDEIAPDTIIIGNGDVTSRDQGLDLADRYGLDGIMIGRGVLRDPFVFGEHSAWVSHTKEQGREMYKRHIELFDQTWGDNRNPASLKKFAKLYLQGFDGASELRIKLMACQNTQDMLQTLVKA